MKPCRFVSGTLETPVKSAPTSGPFTVSSHMIQVPQGVAAPAQFICVPLRLVKASSTSPNGVTSTVLVRALAIESYGVPTPIAAPGPFTS